MYPVVSVSRLMSVSLSASPLAPALFETRIQNEIKKFNCIIFTDRLTELSSDIQPIQRVITSQFRHFIIQF